MAVNHDRPHRLVVPFNEDYHEIRSPEFPEDLDPYGQVPFDVEILKPELIQLKQAIDSKIPQDAGLGKDLYEINLGVTRYGTDDYGREGFTMVDFTVMDSPTPRLDFKTQVYIYDNGVGVTRRLERRWLADGTIADRFHLQRFSNADDAARIRSVLSNIKW